MLSELNFLKIEDFADVKSGKRLPKGHTLTSEITDYPYIRLVDVKDGKIRDNNIQYLQSDTKEKIFRYTINTCDVCLAVVGHTIGMVFQVDREWNNANLTENAVKITNFTDKVDSTYLYYFLSSSAGQHEILSRKVGSAQGKLPMYNVKSLPVPIPLLETQKKIAHILSTLDDKIELNRKMNQTLEEMAQTLFKSWFVDEEKESCKKYRLGDILELKYGKDHKALPDGNIPVYGSGGIMRYANTFIYDKESILIPRKGTLSNIFYINEPFWTVDTIFWSKINIKKVFGNFLFYYLKTINFTNYNVGSAVPSLTTKVLNEIEITLPSLEEQKEFSIYANNAWNVMKANEREIQTLQNIRDTLLPKLLSGELDVTNIKFDK